MDRGEYLKTRHQTIEKLLLFSIIIIRNFTTAVHRSKSWCSYWMLLRLLGEKSTSTYLEPSHLGHEREAEFFQGLTTYLARDGKRSSRKEKI